MVNKSEYDPDLLDFFLTMLDDPNQSKILVKIFQEEDNEIILEELIKEMEKE